MSVLSETVVEDVCLYKMKKTEEQVNNKCSIVDRMEFCCCLLDVGLGIIDQAPVCYLVTCIQSPGTKTSHCSRVRKNPVVDEWSFVGFVGDVT